MWSNTIHAASWYVYLMNWYKISGLYHNTNCFNMSLLHNIRTATGALHTLLEPAQYKPPAFGHQRRWLSYSKRHLPWRNNVSYLRGYNTDWYQNFGTREVFAADNTSGVAQRWDDGPHCKHNCFTARNSSESALLGVAFRYWDLQTLPRQSPDFFL
jgi:hypothetical protein